MNGSRFEQSTHALAAARLKPRRSPLAVPDRAVIQVNLVSIGDRSVQPWQGRRTGESEMLLQDVATV